MPITYFFKKYKNEEETEKINNKHSMLIDEYENDEEEDYGMKRHKMKNDVSCSDVEMKDDNKKIKVIPRCKILTMQNLPIDNLKD